MQRLPDGGPGILAWLVGAAGVALPWVGVGCLGVASWLFVRGPGGWMLFALAGLACFALDVFIDTVMARTLFADTDHPDLNRRADQLVGRVLELAEPIEGGRGKVRGGDTLWLVEGPDAARGTRVKVVRASGLLLHVELVCTSSRNQSGAQHGEPEDRA